MPIRLDDAQLSPAVHTYSPSFFDKSLTGNGRKLGLLCEARNPVNTGKHVPMLPSDDIDPVYHRHVNNGVTTVYVPLGVLTEQAWASIRQWPAPLVPGPKIASLHANANGIDIHLEMEPHSLVLETSSAMANGVRTTSKKLTVCYRFVVMALSKTASDPAIVRNYSSAKDVFRFASSVVQRRHANAHCDNGAFVCYATNPLKMAEHISNGLVQAGFDLDADALNQYLATYSLYDACAKQSENWQVNAADVVKLLLDDVKMLSAAGTIDISRDERDIVANVLDRLDFYRIPLELYRDIYNEVSASLTPSDAKQVCKSNLNLMLSDMLAGINADRDKLEHVEPPAGKQVAVDPFYSAEQRAAITSASPLTIVQSGAGSGKSTSIKGRLDYMRDCGVDLADVLVLSFTNAAADHILDIAPDVHSMTIARMIHTIYSENHPDHELSTEGTLANVLGAYFPDDDLAADFQRCLRHTMRQDDQRALVRLNAFIEAHLDDVLRMLDVVGQTTLTVEIIVCYQCIDSMREPASVACKHILIDEVQDNSIFEFIYVMRHVAKNKESLFIIGKVAIAYVKPC